MKIPAAPPTNSSGLIARPTVGTPAERAVLDSLALKDGQATLARVVEQLPATRTTAAQLLLEIGGQTVAVESDAELKPGTLLRVQRDGNALRLLENLGSSSTSALTQALAQKLPAQFDLQAGLKLIAALAGALPGTEQTPSSPGQSGAAQIRKALAQVLQLMPRQADFSRGFVASGSGTIEQASAAMGTKAGVGPDASQSIRRWVLTSGLFAEAGLAQTRPGSENPADLKSQLLRLALQLLKTDPVTAASDMRQLRPAVSPDLVQQALQFPLVPTPTGQSGRGESANAGALLRIIAGMINRITVNQLHSQVLSGATSTDGAAAPQTWLLELPWLNLQQEPKIIQARIERHADNSASDSERDETEQQAQWRLNLALDLDSLGPVYFEIALTRARLSTRFWAEYEATWRQAEDQASVLRDRLTALGLEVRQLECIHGRPPQTRTRLDQRLVDEKA